MADPAAPPAVAPPPARRRFLWRLLRVVLASYVAIVVVMMLAERSLVYVPMTADQGWLDPPDPRIEDVWFDDATGGRLHAWWLPGPQPADAVLLVCHGNGGNVSGHGRSLLVWRDRLNAAVLVFDYPGYGKSPGTPSEAGCYAAAEAAFDRLAEKAGVPADRVIIYGESLGGGVAVELARRRDHRALVLVKTFTAAPDVGQEVYPWLPVRWLMRNRFDNLTKIADCRRPVFIAHAAADEVVPYAHGERLFAAAPGPKQFLRMDAAGHNTHNDPVAPEFTPQLRQFLKDHAP